MIQPQHLLLLAATSLFTACAVTPLQPPPVNHPASPQATVAPARPMTDRLAKDELTRATENLLNDEAKSQSELPQNSSSDIGNMPGMNH